MIGALNRPGLNQTLRLPEPLEILLVLALGKPTETILLEEPQNGNIQYRRDVDGIHHVPKRPLSEVLIQADTGLRTMHGAPVT